MQLKLARQKVRSERQRWETRRWICKRGTDKQYEGLVCRSTWEGELLISRCWLTDILFIGCGFCGIYLLILFQNPYEYISGLEFYFWLRLGEEED